MQISTINNSTNIIEPLKTTFNAKNLSEGTPLGTASEKGSYDTVHISISGISAKTAEENAKPLEITHEPIAKADLSRYEGKWVVTIYADGTVDDPLSDYNRSQGNYFSDVLSAAMGTLSGKDIYQNAIKSGMTEEQAWQHQKQTMTDHFRNNFDEALDIADKFAPLNNNASGKTIEYYDVYDKNGKLKAPVKISSSEYQKNLQSIVDDMMSHISASKSTYPNLYKTHFGG